MTDPRIAPALAAYNRAMSDGAHGEDIIRRVLEAADAMLPTMTDRLQAVTAELIAALDWHKDDPALTATAGRVAVRLLAAHDRAALAQADELITWIRERRDNCLRHAKMHAGNKVVQDGWLEDADYFANAIVTLSAVERILAQMTAAGETCKAQAAALSVLKGRVESLEAGLRRMISRGEALIGDTGQQPIDAIIEAADEARRLLAREEGK